MPGLVGLITKMPRRDAEAKLLRMLAALLRENFYVTGTWCDESLGLYVGSVERCTSDASYLPIQNECRDLALFISGEVFAEAVKQSGERSNLISEADNDPCFPNRLNGLFHGALADKRNRRAILFNDRYGMHRLYYRQTREAFFFAAEAKAIFAVCSESRSVDPDGMAEFISCGCTLENRTIFEGISVLPGGSAWVFQAGTLSLQGSYFTPKEWEGQAPLDPESYYQVLKEAFSNRIPRYFEGAERVGVSLTGGLDSRMLVSWSGAGAGALQCFSFGSSIRESQDVKIARKVAQACGQTHAVIRVGNEFLNAFAHYAERAVFLTDGCVDVKHAPDLYVSELAARSAPVRVTGNYGGEVLRQVNAFKPLDPPKGLFASSVDCYFAGAKETYSNSLAGHPLSFAVFRQAPWRQYGLLALERTQQTIRSPFLDNEIVRTVFRAPQSSLENNDVSLRLILDGNSNLRAIRTDRGFGRHLPRFAAALQQEYFDFTFKAEYAFDYGMPDNIARLDCGLKSLHLERAFLGRHKFTHFRVWYRDALKQYVREMLLDGRTLARPYLERTAVERVVNEHCAGQRNHTTAIHKLLTLEHIHRLFID
jgi:asparagine synthase (glutamine-hydrolysing)